MSQSAIELMDRSFIERETVTARYSIPLVDALLQGPSKLYYDTHFSHSEDCVYVWGTMQHDDPSYVYMVRLLLPGEA
jgi:hypothetical protein